MANLQKVLILGGEGAIGKELDFGIKVSHEEVNILEEKSVRAAVKKYHPTAILNLASLNLRDCEKDPLQAAKINVEGMANVQKIATEEHIPVILISSGTVFNGPKGTLFDENAIPSPRNTYGLTKYLAEKIVTSYEKGIVVRTGWLFGFTHKRNFFNNVIDAALQGKEINATEDQTGSFTSVSDFQSTLKEVITAEKEGIYHIANNGGASALEFCTELVRLLKSKSPIRAKSIIEDELNGPHRSRSEVLSSTKIKLRNWKLALQETIALRN
ncbi:NAD(P)-dependent oxidoreductase [Candidatus Pacearchaeota archaeon]|nr:NAD(P)-dependent oxidoreductase [Candidatus Pacearchaeota archaeon]